MGIAGTPKRSRSGEAEQSAPGAALNARPHGARRRTDDLVTGRGARKRRQIPDAAVLRELDRGGKWPSLVLSHQHVPSLFRQRKGEGDALVRR